MKDLLDDVTGFGTKHQVTVENLVGFNTFQCGFVIAIPCLAHPHIYMVPGYERGWVGQKALCIPASVRRWVVQQLLFFGRDQKMGIHLHNTLWGNEI